MSIDIDSIRSKADRASMLLNAMGNRNRLMILCQLVNGERSVGKLAELLEARQSTVSQHLALLRRDGFVASRRERQTQYYSLVGDEVRSVLETIQSLYCTPGAKRVRRKRAVWRGR